MSYIMWSRVITVPYKVSALNQFVLHLLALIPLSFYVWLCVNLSLADPRGAPGMRAPLGVQILSFSCSFRQKIEK